MAENKDPLGCGVEQDAVRAAIHVNGFDRRESLGVPHHHGLAATEAVMGFGIDGRAMHAVGIGDFAGRLERIEIKNRHAVPARNVESPAVGVGIDVIKAAFTAYFGMFSTLYGPSDAG